MKVVNVLIFVVLIYLYFVGIADGKSLFLFGTYLNILMIYNYRRFRPVALMLIFLFTYIINLWSYYIDKSDISGGYYQFDNPILYDVTMVAHVIFLFFLYLFLPKVGRDLIILKDKIKVEKNYVAFVLVVGLMIFMYFFGVTGENILQSGGYTKGSKSSLLGLSLNEYFVLFLPVAYKYSNGLRINNILVFIISSLFCLKVFLFGGRVGAIQCMLMIYILYLDHPRLNLLKLMFMALPLVYAMIVFGSIRTNPFILLEKLDVILLHPIKNFSLELFLGNQNSVFYSSVRLIGFVETGIIDLNERLTATISNILAVIVPYKLLPDIANLAGYKKDVYPAGGGALISTYYYIFYSYPGLIFIAWWLAFTVKKAMKTTNHFWLFYAMMVLSTYPRWVGYNPINIFKMSFYVIPIYLIIKSLHQIVRTGEKKNGYGFRY